MNLTRFPAPKIPKLLYGGDYNPEQWPEETWLEDMRLMQKARVNMVSLGIFSWSRLEPVEGQYNVGWLDKLMDLLHEHGIYADLATATASPPAWMGKNHPESLPIQADGIRLWYGSRQAYCPSSRVYREGVVRLATKLAERYKNHPALAMWHVNNEYGCHMWECYCDHCAAKFRSWLKAKYSDLETLNAAWYSDFWSQRYGDWEEVLPPRQTPYMPNPTQWLDWRRFSSDNLLECYSLEAAALRRVTPEIPVTTNFMGFHKQLDYWRWAEELDLIANDIYPDPTDSQSPLIGAMSADLMRSLGQGKPWLIMEQVTGQVQWRDRNAIKRPGQMRLWSYQAIARGSSGIMFFQWRASKGGGERFHGAMLPHSGTASRIWQEVVQLGSELEQLAPQGNINPEVAMVFDWDNWWALESDGHPARLQLMPQVQAWYKPFFKRNLPIDFAQSHQDLSRYKAVLVPNLHLIRPEAAQNLEHYVAGGGTLLVGSYSGIVDQNVQVYLPGYPGALRKLLGIWVEEFDVLNPDDVVGVQTQGAQNFNGKNLVDVIDLEGAKALAHFTDGFAVEKPAFTQYGFGNGQSFYLGTQLQAEGLDWAIAEVLSQAKVKVASVQAGLEQISQHGSNGQWTFYLNHNSQPIEVQAEGRDVLTGEQVRGTVRLEGYGVLVLEQVQTPSAAELNMA